VRLVEQDAASTLLGKGFVVVAGGGGGIPVVESEDGLTGVEAVVDKDATASLIAITVNADRLIILTDVEGIMRDFGTPQQQRIAVLALTDLAHEDYPPGSMGPKVEACADFVAATGNACAIGALRDAARLVDGSAGTQIIADAAELTVIR